MNASPRPARDGANRRVVGCGVVVVDHQVFVKELPEPDHKTDIISERIQVGGPTPTALALLSGFGASATFLGAWGKDADGRLIEEDFRRLGIEFDPGLSRRPERRTGFAHVWVDSANGARSIAAFRGEPEFPFQKPPEALLRDANAVLLDGWPVDFAIKVAQATQTANGLVFLDLGSPKDRLRELLRPVTHLNVPSRMIERLFGHSSLDEGARRLLAMGPNSVSITHGERGATLYTDERKYTQAAFPVRALDTTGAGDVFAGAIAHATLEGLAPQDRLRFACAAAALKCEKVGNRDALPQLSDISELLDSNQNHEPTA